MGNNYKSAWGKELPQPEENNIFNKICDNCNSTECQCRRCRSILKPEECIGIECGLITGEALNENGYPDCFVSISKDYVY